jgi:hypothetical protein
MIVDGNRFIYRASFFFIGIVMEVFTKDVSEKDLSRYNNFFVFITPKIMLWRSPATPSKMEVLTC